jgi:hypothetical protein
MHRTSALPKGSERVRSANARALADRHDGLFRGPTYQDQEVQPSSTSKVGLLHPIDQSLRQEEADGDMDRRATQLPLRFPRHSARSCDPRPNGNPAPELFVILDRDVLHLDSTATRKCWPHLRSAVRTPRRATGPALSDELVAQKGQWLTSSQHSASLRLVFGACPFGCTEV